MNASGGTRNKSLIVLISHLFEKANMLQEVELRGAFEKVEIALLVSPRSLHTELNSNNNNNTTNKQQQQQYHHQVRGAKRKRRLQRERNDEKVSALIVLNDDDVSCMCQRTMPVTAR